MHSLLFIPLGVQRLFYIRNNILCILYTYLEANQVGAYTCLHQLLVCQLAVCMAGWV